MMRHLTAKVLLFVATWMIYESTAFIAAPACRCPQRRSLREQSHQQLWHRCGVAPSSPSIDRVYRKIRSPAFMVDGGQGDGGRWARAGAMMGARGGLTPEEMMRQMSIPDLAQKLDQAESMYGQVHPQVAGALIPLAQAMFANGDLGPARDACTRALKILQVSFGQTPRIETAECLHTMAMIQKKENPEIGDKALGSQNMALELVMRVCGPDSIEAAAYSRCLAQMSEDYAQYLAPDLPRPFYMPDPVLLYRRTLAILEKLLGKDHPEVASALDDLTSALLFWRDADSTDMRVADLLPEAEELAARSLAISSASMGAEHTMTAGREHNLGMVKRARGREDEALEHFQRALEIRQKVLGADHPDTKSSRTVIEEGKNVSSAES